VIDPWRLAFYAPARNHEKLYLLDKFYPPQARAKVVTLFYQSALQSKSTRDIFIIRGTIAKLTSTAAV
jgi:hypothetical protein